MSSGRLSAPISALPAFGICGWSGSGKTTLLVEVVRRLVARGMKIAVVKDDVHGHQMDCHRKDSDMLFHAGADVVLTGPEDGFSRFRSGGSATLEAIVSHLDLAHDLVLLEGHKSANIARKVWLLKDSTEICPLLPAPGLSVLAPAEDRAEAVMTMIDSWMAERRARTPVCAGVLIGGASSRMRAAKHLLSWGDGTWLEHIVTAVRPAVSEIALLGAGRVPGPLCELAVLPDVPGKQGPLAGMLAAMRWRPDAAWLFVACDLPRISTAAVEWLLGRRAPGVWAVMPRLPGAGGPEPLFAVYEFRARAYLESSSAPSMVADKAGVITPEPPSALAEAWANMNTQADVERWRDCCSLSP